MKILKYSYQSIFTIIAVFGLHGCVPMLPETYNSDNNEITIPDSYLSGSDENNKNNRNNNKLIDDNRKLLFKDPKLITLIDTAIARNQELHMLDQEINVARNEIMARRGEYLPMVGFSGSYEFEKVGEETSQGASDEIAGVAKRLQNRRIGLVASWEVDIWKKLRNAAESAYYEYMASIEARKFAVTLIVAEVSSSYYELIALDSQLEILKKYITTLEKAQEVVKYLKNSGRTTSLAVKRFGAEIEKSKAKKYELLQTIVVTENKMNALLGRFPKSIERSSLELTAMQISELSAGVPSYLIDNRPDIIEAKLQLEATKLDVESVRARFYPSLSIESAFGLEAFKEAHFLKSPESVFYNLALGIAAPLLNRQAIKADYFTANNNQLKAIYNYEKVLVKSVAEVSNQLANINNFKEIYKAKLEQLKAMQDSVDIANMLFKSARVDYLESLLAQRDLLEVQIEVIETRKNQLISYVGLYKSLGGGWIASEKNNT